MSELGLIAILAAKMSTAAAFVQKQFLNLGSHVKHPPHHMIWDMKCIGAH